MFWGLVFLVRSLWTANLLWVLNLSLSLSGTGYPAVVIIPPFVGCLPEVVGLDCTMHLPLLTISLWFLLCIFSCRKYQSVSLQVVLVVVL